MDKSGTEQGAGGVGGLLAVSVDGTFFIPCYDHNGNIVRYVSENGSTAAQYTYDPYGNVIEALGALAEQFPFGFSTKYHDRETGLVSYLMRFYNPPDGRWLNRDPIEEQGGENLYAFCRNNGVSNIDAYGLVTYYRCTAKAQTIIARAISNAIMVIPQVIDHIVSLEISESLSHHAVPQHVNAILQRKGLKPITLEEHVKLDGFTIIVLANLYRLENMLKGGNFGVECKCEKDSGCKSKAGPAEAYVAKGRLAKIISGRNINICPEFFNNSSKEQRGRIIHEASHWHSDINTDDYYAAPGEWELCAKDADFYDQLSKNQGLYFDFSIQYGIRRMREGGGK
jgi:RHS repeat-associated protein